jgi:hypothetical protein
MKKSSDEFKNSIIARMLPAHKTTGRMLLIHGKYRVPNHLFPSLAAGSMP